jgi:hypothetical protein
VEHFTESAFTDLVDQQEVSPSSVVRCRPFEGVWGAVEGIVRERAVDLRDRRDKFELAEASSSAIVQRSGFEVPPIDLAAVGH